MMSSDSFVHKIAWGWNGHVACFNLNYLPRIDCSHLQSRARFKNDSVWWNTNKIAVIFLCSGSQWCAVEIDVSSWAFCTLIIFWRRFLKDLICWLIPGRKSKDAYENEYNNKQVCQPFSCTFCFLYVRLYITTIVTVILFWRLAFMLRLFKEMNFKHLYSPKMLIYHVSSVSNHRVGAISNIVYFSKFTLCLEDAPFITFTNVNEHFRGRYSFTWEYLYLFY